MTVREKLESRLVSDGMSEVDAKEVMELAIPEINKSDRAGGYKVTFNRNCVEYPDAIYSVLYRVIRPIAYGWISKNKPKAWYREMFA